MLRMRRARCTGGASSSPFAQGQSVSGALLPLSRRGFRDCQEILGLQAGAADQATADIGHREQGGGVGRRIEPPYRMRIPCPASPNSTHQLLADEGVHHGDVLLGGGLSGADGPDRLVGDHAVKGFGRLPAICQPTNSVSWPPTRWSSVSPTQTIGVSPASVAASEFSRTSSSVSPCPWRRSE